MIPENDIARVMGRVHIEDVIEEKLTKAGANFKCCCPFHQEKTASFLVFPSTNTYKCFGCGKQGNAINYLMERFGYSYPETIHKLADKYHVTISEEVQTEMSNQQKEEQHKRELMIAAYQKVQQLYVSNLRQNTLEARTALEYAEGRWGAEFLDQMGIGYAYNSYDQLKNFAKEQHISEAILIELGLLKHNEEKDSVYDFFRGRIMIPIRSNSHLLIGYTSRLVDKLAKPTASGELPAKYINSPNSLLYTKDQSIFGIDRAQRKGAADDMFYLVEGGPDVLRLQIIGIDNAVASLGSDWTTNQLEKLKRTAHNVCLIPDIDVPKPGEDFGTGIRKVMKTGEVCLRMGFDSVLVKEIVTGQPKDDKTKKYKVEKADADSYFKNKNLFDQTKEMPFIVWYAAKLSHAHPDNATENISTIARLLCHVKEDYKVNILIAQIGTYISATQKIWTEAIKNAKREASKEILKAGKKNTFDGDMLEKYGFQEKDNCYVAVGDKGKAYPWSNFVLKPLFHIKDITSSSRLFRIINEDDQEEIIELSQDDLVSRTMFMKKIEALGNFIFMGKDEQLTSLKRYLYKVTNTAYLIRQMGWQRKGFFAFGNGCYFNMKWYAVDSYGIVRLPTVGNFYLPAFSQIYTEDAQYYQFERGFIYSDVASFTLEEYLKLMILVFGDNAKIAFCYLLASLFHDVVKLQTKTFPLLNVFGPKGSGKSELGHCLTSFFVCGNVPPNLTTSTLPALAESVAQSANAIVHLDELRNDIDQEKREFLKGLFDGTGRSRLNMERDKKRESTRVDSGVVVTGQEMATADIALFARFVFLTFPKSQFSQAETNRFNKLLELRRQGCTHLTVQLLDFRKHFERHFAENYYNIGQQIRKDLADKLVDARLINNWTTLVAAFSALETKLKVPFQLDDLYAVALKGLMNQSEMCSQNTEIAAFWETIAFLFSEAKIFYGCEFRIERVNRINLTEYSEPYVYTEVRTVLFFRFICNYEAYAQHRTSVKESTLPRASMKYYLSVHPAYLGSMKSMAFHCIVKGEQVYEISIGKDGKERRKKKLTRDQVMCFDYDMLKKLYNINLEHIVSSTDEDLYEDISVVKNAEDDE